MPTLNKTRQLTKIFITQRGTDSCLSNHHALVITCDWPANRFNKIPSFLDIRRIAIWNIYEMKQKLHKIGASWWLVKQSDWCQRTMTLLKHKNKTCQNPKLEENNEAKILNIVTLVIFSPSTSTVHNIEYIQHILRIQALEQMRIILICAKSSVVWWFGHVTHRSTKPIHKKSVKWFFDDCENTLYGQNLSITSSQISLHDRPIIFSLSRRPTGSYPTHPDECSCSHWLSQRKVLMHMLHKQKVSLHWKKSWNMVPQQW